MTIRSVDGHTPVIHPDAFVSETAYVVGNVEIGAFSSVWPGSVIRGESKIVIGRNVCVQDGSVIHAEVAGAVIGDDVTIGHRVMCHAERIGDGATLANGCVVNAGAIIGAGAVVASGAVVVDNAEVPENTIVVGVPAVAKGTVAGKHVERFKLTVRHYVELGQMYKAAGLEDRTVTNEA
jgi:carbonic anhydrase/acetyltransferase-like protein (isoleucine patch superfamily)